MKETEKRKPIIYYGWIVVLTGLLANIGSHGFGRMASASFSRRWPRVWADLDHGRLAGNSKLYRLHPLRLGRGLFGLTLWQPQNNQPIPAAERDQPDAYGDGLHFSLCLADAFPDRCGQRRSLCPGYGPGIALVCQPAPRPGDRGRRGWH